MPTVRFDGFPPVEVAVGTTLLEAAEAGRVPMDSACGGFAACNSCRVRVLEGAEGLSPRVPEEDAFLDAPGQRLGCQARVEGDVAVRLEPG